MDDTKTHPLWRMDIAETSFENVVESYSCFLMKIIYGILRNTDDSEDALQEILQKIHQGLPAWRGGNFKAWIARIAVNHSIDALKVRMAERAALSLDEDTMERSAVSGLLAADTDSPYEMLVRKESNEEIMDIIAGLPEIYREIIILYYETDQTVKEIADGLELNQRTVETRIFRAKKMIREKWGRNAH